MPNLTEQIQNIDIVPVVEAAGVVLTRRGRNHTACCPFHDDRNPSFVIFPNHRWWCFSENIGGDACDFVQRFHGCSFSDACRYLGVESGKLTAEDHRRIADAKRKRAERAIQQRYEADLCFTIGTLIRWTRKAMTAINPANWDDFSDMIDQLPYFEHAHDILIFGPPEEKQEVIEAFKGFQIINRNRLFKDDFDYRGWLHEFKNGAMYEGKFKRQP